MTRTRIFVLAAVGLLAGAMGASAAGCPTAPVTESGGSHWCYDAGHEGHVHLWTPAAFDVRTAVTVVYVHGYNLSARSRQVWGKRVGVEGCANAHYLDCAWDAQGLAKQFAASGLNALFIAVEGPINDGQGVKWTSLDPILSSVASKGGLAPPGKIAAVAHSAGIFTVMRFLENVRLAHVVALDALYQDAPRRLARWSGPGRRLTLVGAASAHARTAALGKRLGCVSVSDMTTAYPADALTAECAAVIDKGVAHMDVVWKGAVIPHALARIE